jgi:hypothetical protein
LTKIERARGFLEAAKLSEDWISEMQERALVLEAHHTTHIAGTDLSLEQAERLSLPKTPSDRARGDKAFARRWILFSEASRSAVFGPDFASVPQSKPFRYTGRA